MSTMKLLSQLMEICSIPQLLQDIEDNPIHKDYFSEFTQLLEINSPILLDYLSDQDNWKELNCDDDCDLVQLRMRLIMLSCEHAPVDDHTCPPYTINRKFSTHLSRICSTLITSGSLLSQCLDTYKTQLLNQKWKTSIGSCYGFVHFSELFLKTHPEVDLQTILFILSIASQFIDCIHGEIKYLGLHLYRVILQRSPAKLILESNVHKVVIKSCLDNCQKLLNEDCLTLLWENIGQSICMDVAILSCLNWNELDDCLHLLFQKIKLEAKREMRVKLRRVLLRVIERCSGLDGGPVSSAEELLTLQERVQDRKLENLKLFRWINDLKDLFIFECLSTSNSPESTEESLLFIATSYLLTMFGVPAKIIGPTLDELTKRITPLLMEICNIYKESHSSVITLIATFLKILIDHLDEINHNVVDQSNYHCALKELMSEHLQPLISPP